MSTPNGKVNPALTRWLVPLDRVKLDPKNPRIHPVKNLEAIKNSLQQFGQQTPIVITKEKIIVKGNGTYEAAKALGWAKIAAIPTDLVTKRLLTGYKVADNKTGDLADWDFEVLADQIKEFEDIDWKSLGWEDWELDPMLGAVWKPAAINDDDPSLSGHSHSLVITQEQYEVIARAVAKCRESLQDGDVSEGRCLELICADYLASD